MKQAFVHLHNHTEHSALDGKAKIPAYVRQAKALGNPALGIMDHGVLGGTYEFYMECLEAGIEPILGEEFYFVPDAEAVKADKDAERFHVGIIAKGERGYRILVELSSESHRRFYYYPLIDRQLLESIPKADRKHLVVLSGCANSIISRKALGAVDGSARDEVNWWRSLFPNFHFELMHHNTDFDRRLNLRLLKLARKYDVPWVVTNDPHYVLKEECAAHDALLAIGTNSDIDDPNRFRFSGSGYHLRSDREMARAFRSYERDVWQAGAAETLRVAKACRTRISAFDNRSWHIPRFASVSDADRELRSLARDGLRDRGLADRPEYRRRVKHELEQFAGVPGMADFLLIDREAKQYAESIGIRVGPGRGSVCGTLVGYLVGIHKIDSVRYDLLFERFLNPERPKMPDIDSDFQGTRRGEMIQHAIDTYGDENTQRVGAHQTMQIKRAFRNLARAYGIDFKNLNRLSAMLHEDIEGNIVLPPEIMEGYPDLYGLLEELSGLKSGMGRHPAGVIIFDPDDDVRDLVPIQWIASSKAFVSQFDLDTAAGIGLTKNDYLSLRTLDTIDVCLQLIKERHGVELEPDEWVPDEEEHDAEIYFMLAEGKVDGVFQMEGGTNRRGIKEIACESFEDIVSCTSLYRKGPLEDGADARFLANKRDGKVRVAHPSLKQFLARSWGELIYQEQMFEILHSLAGFSWSRVDDAKTAMTKKDPVKMAALKGDAIKGFMEVSEMKRKTAEQVWDKIQACAGYLFNRSHAVAYSMLTYQTARLKYLYPLEFMAALLATVDPKSDDAKEKRQRYMGEASRMGFKILPPDINLSDAAFKPVGDDALIFGLQDIKDVGPTAVTKILNYRSKKQRRFRQRELDTSKAFRTVAEVNILVNKRVLAALAHTGALTGLGIPANPDVQEELLAWQFNDPMKNFRKKLTKRVKWPRGNGSLARIAGQITKVDARKTKTNKTYVTWTVRWKPGEEYRVNVWDSASKLHRLRKGSIVLVSGKWNEQFANIGVSDDSDVRVFHRVVSRKKDKESSNGKAEA